jgi:hypothetical protein
MINFQYLTSVLNVLNLMGGFYFIKQPKKVQCNTISYLTGKYQLFSRGYSACLTACFTYIMSLSLQEFLQGNNYVQMIRLSLRTPTDIPYLTLDGGKWSVSHISHNIHRPYDITPR